MFVRPDDGSPIVCCPLWSVDDWVGMQPGVRVDFEVDRAAGLMQVARTDAKDAADAGAGDAVQVGTAVRIRADSGSTALFGVLSQLESMIAQENSRRLKRLLFLAAQGQGFTPRRDSVFKHITE